MPAPKSIKDVAVQERAREEEKQEKKPILVAEIKAEGCCEPGCGPDTCGS